MKPNLVLFTSRQNDPTGCILVRKYQKIQSTDQSTILTNYNILLNLKLKVEITAFEFKLTANKSYRSTVGDRLGGGGESRQGMNGHVFFRDTFVWAAE
jgi:hypothetical protein